VDYDQSHHCDFGNHTLVVLKRCDPATQMQSSSLAYGTVTDPLTEVPPDH
jgi:hypothetical protein